MKNGGRSHESAHSLTKAQLKKKLKEMTREELEGFVIELYSSKVAREVINGKLGGEEYLAWLIKEYKAELDKVVFDPVKFSLREAKAIVKTFNEECDDPASQADIELYFAESLIDFSNTYGDMEKPFYDALCKAVENAVAIVDKNPALAEKFYFRLQEDARRVMFGWGVEEELRRAEERVMEKMEA